MVNTPMRRLLLMLALLGALYLPASLFADTVSDDCRKLAAAAENKQDWIEACRLYDKALRADRNQPDLREAYQRALRRAHLVQRHSDPVYRQAVAKLSPSEALEVYDQVLLAVCTSYFDRTKTDVEFLFQQGLQELRYALEEKDFRREYLPSPKPLSLTRFKSRIADLADRKIATRAEAHKEVADLLLGAREDGLNGGPKFAAAVALEFASGACNSLDEYSTFLTPGYAHVQRVGVGVDLDMVKNNSMERQLVVTHLYPKSPAADAGVRDRDRILRIDGVSAEDLSLETAVEKLRGEAGSTVVLEIRHMDDSRAVSVSVQRRGSPSVEPKLLLVQTPEMGIEPVPVGFIQINHFTDTTVEDVKEALAQLQTNGARALILDLRGNPGGSFKAGVQTAELFLDEGVIVFAKSPLPDYDQPFKSTSKNPVTLPVVVLVDRDTASAAEVVAGALQDNRPSSTFLVGQKTFGKGSVQGVIPLDKAPLEKNPGGVRLSVAKLFTPGKHLPYTDRGVTPDLIVDQEGEEVTAFGVQEALRLIKQSPSMMR
jgi:carboxyl-terminal processing protease